MEKTKRPKTAKNVNALEKYTTLEQKHSDMKKTLKNPKLNSLAKGAFHKISQVDNTDVVISEDIDGQDFTDEAKSQNVYNTLFIRALLKTAGEPTIAYGKTETNIGGKEQEITYMTKAGKDMVDLYNNQEKEDLISVLDCFRTDRPHKLIALKKKYLDSDEDSYVNMCVLDNVNFGNLNEADLKTIARHFCKIFLFQMYDRKPENLLALKKEKDNKNQFVKIDFDLGSCPDKYGNLHVIECIFGISNSQDVSTMWETRIEQLYEQYNNFIKKIEESPKIKTWEEIFKETVEKEYTMTEEKIVKIIQEMTRNAKYIGIDDREEIIEQVQKKLLRWKYMLDTTQTSHHKLWSEIFLYKYTGQNIDKIGCMKDARKDTLKALNKFVEKNGKIDEQKIEKIVNLEIARQDFGIGLETKHCKEDVDIINKEKTHDLCLKALDEHLKALDEHKKIKQDKDEFIKEKISRLADKRYCKNVLDLYCKTFGSDIKKNKDTKNILNKKKMNKKNIKSK